MMSKTQVALTPSHIPRLTLIAFAYLMNFFLQWKSYMWSYLH